MSTETTTSATPPPPPPGRRYHRRGTFWPIVLIGIGLVALLGNYGLVAPMTWLSLIALWPVLLILLGIDIAFARRWPLPTLTAEVAIIALALVLAVTQPASLGIMSFTFGDRSGGCASPSSNVTVGRGAMERLALTIEGGAARYRVTSGATGAVEASSDTGELCIRDRSSGTRGDVRLTQGGFHFSGGSEILVKVPSDLPLTLTVNGGAGEFFYDLHDVKLVDAGMSIGAATVTMILPHPTGELRIRADGGASSLVFEVPADVEVRVSINGGLVSASSVNPRATRSGNVIETAGYASAKDRVTISVNGGASSVTVR
ncbi:MAG TPA: DUF5668 domain-containing protein [Candidatus Limnocylindria bacterium]